MKNTLTKYCFSLTLCLLFSAVGHAQKMNNRQDSSKQRMTKLIARQLRIDSAKAVRVNTVQDSYKVAVGNVIANNSLSEIQKRKAIDDLIAQKNLQLSALLTAEQQAKFIPGTEQKKTTIKQKP